MNMRRFAWASRDLAPWWLPSRVKSTRPSRWVPRPTRFRSAPRATRSTGLSTLRRTCWTQAAQSRRISTRTWSGLEMYYSDPYVGEADTGHHVFRTRITDARQTISFGLWLSDIDTSWEGWDIVGQDMVCSGEVRLDARDLREWGRLNDTYEIRDSPAQDSCLVTVTVRGTPVP
jgi:hypothetical protein